MDKWKPVLKKKGNWTWEDPRTWGHGNLQSSSVALSFMTEMQLVSLFLSLWVIESAHSDALCAISHYVVAFFIVHSANPSWIVSFIACKTTSGYSYRGFGGQRSNANRLETLSLCVQAWLCKADRRLLCRAKKSENSVVLTPSVCIARAVAIGFGLVCLVASAGHAPTKNIWNIGAMRLLLRPSLVQYNASRDPGPRVRSRVQCLCWGWLESMLIEMRRWGDRALNRHWRTALPSWRSSSE